ncbi:MAG: hypothetical protein DSY81_00055 [Bacillota bacterium]|nr:MAG: hypothetical protein DSY81_00055 [Bacillota bacterium]
MQLLEQFLVNLDVATHHRIGTEFVLLKLLPRCCEVCCSGRVIEQFIDHLGELAWICRSHEAAGDAILDHLGDAADGAGDHGSPRSECIEDAGAESFIEAGVDEEIESMQPR